jgi:hypothetical protein
MDRPAHGHEPVMMSEVLLHLDPQPGHVFVDCTVGRGGHSFALATAVAPGGTLIGLDYDPRNLAFAGERLAGLPARLFHANFAEIDDALKAAGVEQVDGILADLGISTNQLFDEPYGLSFTVDQPLDMRLDPRTRVSAHTIVNTWREEDIADALFRLADERFSRRIARKIVENPSANADRNNRTLGRVGAHVRAADAGEGPSQSDRSGDPHLPCPAHGGQRRDEQPGTTLKSRPGPPQARRKTGDPDLPLHGRPAREARVSVGGADRAAEHRHAQAPVAFHYRNRCQSPRPIGQAAGRDATCSVGLIFTVRGRSVAGIGNR